MSGKCCKGKSNRPHTPIVSRQQQKLFSAVASGKSTKASSLSKAEAERHLEESKGKNLPKYHSEAGRKVAVKKLKKKAGINW